MLLVLAGLAGILAGLAAGGSLTAMTRLRFRRAWIVAVALLVKEAGVFGPLAHSSLTPILYTASLAALTAWTLWHVDQLRALAVAGAGIALNALVAAANGGRMPVSPELAATGPAELRLSGHLGQYVLAGPGTRLAVLDDWLALPPAVHAVLPYAYSPGDLVVAVGILCTGFEAVRLRTGGAAEGS